MDKASFGQNRARPKTEQRSICPSWVMTIKEENLERPSQEEMHSYDS